MHSFVVFKIDLELFFFFNLSDTKQSQTHCELNRKLAEFI